MDLIVLDATGTLGATVSAALPEISVSCVADVAELRAQSALAATPLPIVLCSSQQDLLECAKHEPKLPSAYWADKALTADQMLQTVRAGARDVWYATAPAGDWRASVLRLQDAVVDAPSVANETVRDAETARKIQQGMWPADGIELLNYKFSRRLLPATTLTGDFVDYFPIGERYLAFFVADVAGHGTSSALLTVVLKNISWRLQQRYGRPRFRAPGEMLDWINKRLLEQSAGMHVAMFLGVIDMQKQTLHYSSAAHFPPSLLVAKGGKVTSLEQRGKPLGLFENAQYESAAIDIALGDRVVVFSDGVLELLHQSDLADKEQKLRDQASKTQSVESLWSSLTKEVSGKDDVSLLVVERIK
jgi:hypothetical protein